MHDSNVAGNTRANNCSELRCQNGGTCTAAGSQNVQCSCPRGSRGPYCEHGVPSCPDYGHFDPNAMYYAVDSFEGSLAAWFCPSGSGAEFGYSVCENRLNDHSWSNSAACPSLTTATQPTSTPYSYFTHRIDIFKDVKDWLTPVVMVCVLAIQIGAPFITYFCILVYCCGYDVDDDHTSQRFARDDCDEDYAIEDKYKKQLRELESRTPKPENAVMISELRRIQHQLEEEIDQVRARRRKRDREGYKVAKPFRTFSFYYYVSLWLWLIYLIIYYGANLDQYSDLFGTLSTIAIICVSLLYIVILVESWLSSERQYIKNLSELTSATERIESIRNTQPNVSMIAECYHYELRTRTVSYTDANGHSHSRTESYQEKVISAVIRERFLFTHWFDCSQSSLTDVGKVGITKIDMQLTVQFGDETTAQHFNEKFERFKHQNRDGDVFVQFFVSTTVYGFEKRLAAYTDAGNKPGWIGSRWFWLATFFCLGWPYRIVFNHITQKTEYNVVKIIFTSIPFTAATPADPNYIPEPPSENAEEDIINNIKTNIQRILHRRRSTPGLSENDREVPIRCAVTDQHMNVTLREAHHPAEQWRRQGGTQGGPGHPIPHLASSYDEFLRQYMGR